MLARIRAYVLAVVFAMSVGGLFTTVAMPQTAAAAACQDRVLTFPTWYRGLGQNAGGGCEIKPPTCACPDEINKYIWTIVLNIIEIVLQLIAYVCVGYIIYGGFVYIAGSGTADKITAGRKIITNAVVGLVLSFFSIGIVNFIVGNFTSAGNVSVAGNQVNVPKVEAADIISGVLNTVYWAGGVVAVIAIVAAGILYATSQGEAAKIQRAKNAILYAVVGLIVIAMAFVITNFVIGRF